MRWYTQYPAQTNLHGENPKNTRLKDEETQEPPEGTNISGRGGNIGMRRQKITEEEVKVLNTASNTWKENDQGSVEIKTHKPEMNRNDGYDIPAI